MSQISHKKVSIFGLRVSRCLSPSPRVVVAGVVLVFLIVWASMAGATPRLGWTAPKIVIAVPRQDMRGYAATAFQRHAYVVDVTDAHTGGKNISQVWFSTNRSGKWVRELVAALPDDPDTDGVAMPQIVVVPASGHVVIAAMDNTAAAGKLVSYSNASGSWQPLALSEGSGDDAIHDEQAPALAAQGGNVTLAFNASYVATTAACSQNEGNLFVSTASDGVNTWSPPHNVTQDYCQPSLFARHPVLAYSPSGVLYMLYQYSGDSNTLNALRVRSGSFAASTEQVIDPAPSSGNWGLNSALGFYDLSFDAQGAPQVVYQLDGGSTTIPPRLMYAVRGGGGWTRSVLHQVSNPGADTDLESVAPAIAIGETGITVAFEGAATYPLGGTGAEAVYLMTMNGGGWTPPANFTRSRYTDTAPILATSDGRKHLFMLRQGVGYLYSRELPYPQINEQLPGAATPAVYATAQTVTFSGSVAAATQAESVGLCLQRQLSANHWSSCQGGDVRTRVQGQSGVFSHAFPGLTAGRYRVRVTVPETDDHLAGVGDELQFAIH